jgi:hypothetical protein
MRFVGRSIGKQLPTIRSCYVMICFAGSKCHFWRLEICWAVSLTLRLKYTYKYSRVTEHATSQGMYSEHTDNDIYCVCSTAPHYSWSVCPLISAPGKLTPHHAFVPI